jgi:hypothetical protein
MFGCHHEYSWLGLALAIRACTDEVIKIVENRDDAKPKKRRHRHRSADNNEPFGPQMLLFPVDKKAREKFAEFVETVECCLMKNNHSGLRLPKADYYGYEMFDFIRGWKDEEWEPQLAKMKRIADGEIPNDEECLNLISFLDKVERHADANWHHQNRGGGCFA